MASMIILIIDKFGIGADKAERHAPIAIDPHRPMPLQIALQRVQFEGRQIHIRWPRRHVEQAQDIADFPRMGCLNPPRCAASIKGLKPLVPEPDDHDDVYRVSLHDASAIGTGLDPGRYPCPTSPNLCHARPALSPGPPPDPSRVPPHATPHFAKIRLLRSSRHPSVPPHKRWANDGVNFT